jgi:spore germination protein
MKACLEYLLSLGVRSSKISLGLAGCSDWWYPAYDDTNGAQLRGSDISYGQLKAILDSAGVRPPWDDTQKALYAAWEVKGVFRHAWLEDARAFMAKLELARTYRLRGYSVWVLGAEDEAVWKRLPRR